MSDKPPLIEEIRGLMWEPPASNSEKDEINRLRAENAQLSLVARACTDRLIEVEMERDKLRAQIAAHEKVCAGTWVKVTERLPEPRRVVSTRTADHSWMPSNWIEVGAWRIEHNRVVEWLDARTQGE